MKTNKTNAVDDILRIAFRHLVTEANVEAGVARIQELTGRVLLDTVLHDALAASLRDGLIREPIRLPTGALHCQWRLELTARGVVAARGLLPADGA